MPAYYKYEIDTVLDSESTKVKEKILNDRGFNGWRLVSVTHDWSIKSTNYYWAKDLSI